MTRSASPIGAPRHARRDHGLGGDVSHGEPPSCEGPRRALPRADGGRHDLVSIVGRRPQVQVLEDRGQVAFEPGCRRSCDLPSGDRRRGRVGIGDRRAAHRREGVMQPGLRRAQRDAQGRRHLGQRHPQEVVQRDDRAVRRDRGAGAPRPRARGRRARPSRRAAWGSRWALSSTSIGRRRRLRARSRQALTVRRWSQASNRSGIAKSRQVAPGADERLLDRVARELRVPEDQAGRRVQPREPGSTSWAKAS